MGGGAGWGRGVGKGAVVSGGDWGRWGLFGAGQSGRLGIFLMYSSNRPVATENKITPSKTKSSDFKQSLTMVFSSLYPMNILDRVLLISKSA